MEKNKPYVFGTDELPHDFFEKIGEKNSPEDGLSMIKPFKQHSHLIEVVFYLKKKKETEYGVVVDANELDDRLYLDWQVVSNTTFKPVLNGTLNVIASNFAWNGVQVTLNKLFIQYVADVQGEAKEKGIDVNVIDFIG